MGRSPEGPKMPVRLIRCQPSDEIRSLRVSGTNTDKMQYKYSDAAGWHKGQKESNLHVRKQPA
ncbi:hypothetical protein LQZ18_00550 [Lachnospiraceae bacterium ZAX-1]